MHCRGAEGELDEVHLVQLGGQGKFSETNALAELLKMSMSWPRKGEGNCIGGRALHGQWM